MDAPDTATAPPRPDRRSRLRRLALDAALIVGVFLAASAWQGRNLLPSGQRPALSARDLAGQPVSLEGLRGRPAMVAFWAPWCGVCSAQSDNLGRVQRWLGARASVVSVAAGYGDEAEVRRHVAEKGIAYPVWLGGDDAARAFNVDVYPTIYFLDAEGRVKGSVSGYTSTLGMLWRLLW